MPIVMESATLHPLVTPRQAASSKPHQAIHLEESQKADKRQISNRRIEDRQTPHLTRRMVEEPPSLGAKES